jgi:hypothetical protein
VARAAYIMKLAGEKDRATKYARFCQDAIDDTHDSRILLSAPWVDRKDFFALTNVFTYKVNGQQDDLVRALKLSNNFAKTVLRIDRNGLASWHTINGFPVTNSEAVVAKGLTKDQLDDLRKNNCVAKLNSNQRAKLTSLMKTRMMDASHSNRQPMMATEFFRLASRLPTKSAFTRRHLLAMAKSLTQRLTEWPDQQQLPLIHSFVDGKDWVYVLDEANLFATKPGRYGSIYNGWCQLGAYDPAAEEECEFIVSRTMAGKVKVALNTQISFVGRMMRNLKDLGRP